MSGTGGPAGGAGEPGDGPAAESARLAEEIRLLVDLVTERAEPWLRSVFAAGHGRGDPGSCGVPGSGQPGAGVQDEPHPDTTAPEGSETAGPGGDGGPASACSWCPFCAVVSVARGDTPEIAARVLEQAVVLIALLRAVLADRWQPDEGVHMPGYRPSARPGPAPAGTASSGTSVFAERPRRGPAAAGSARRVQRVPVRPRESWEPEG